MPVNGATKIETEYLIIQPIGIILFAI